MSKAPIQTERLEQTNLSGSRTLDGVSEEPAAIPAIDSTADRRSDNRSKVAVHSPIALPARPTSNRRQFLMNSIVSTASLATATAVTVSPTATTSFPDLVARFVQVHARWVAQRSRDEAWSDKISDLFYKTSGITNEQRLAMDESDPRWEAVKAQYHKAIDDTPDDDPVDEYGASIAWDEIWDELWPVSEAMISREPKSIVDLGWQAEALVTAHFMELESPGTDLGEQLIRKLIRNVRAFTEPLPLPTTNLVTTAPTPDPIFAAIAEHKSAVETFLKAVRDESKIEETLPRDRCKSNITAYERKIIETDDPRWIEVTVERDRTSTAMEDAAITIIETEPETLQGAAAVLRYMVDHMDRYHGMAMGWPDSLLPDGVDPDAATWHASRGAEYFLMQNVAASIERLSKATA